PKRYADTVRWIVHPTSGLLEGGQGRRQWVFARRTPVRRTRFVLVPFHYVDASDQQPNAQRQQSKNGRQEQEEGCGGRREDLPDVSGHEAKPTERQQHPYYPREVARSRHQVSQDYGSDAVKQDEEEAASRIHVERQQRERLQLLRRERLQIPIPTQDQR